MPQMLMITIKYILYLFYILSYFLAVSIVFFYIKIKYFKKIENQFTTFSIN